MSAYTAIYTGNPTVSSTEFSLPGNSTTLATKTDSGPIFIKIDVSALAVGDEYEMLIYEKARGADTKQVAYRRSFTGPQALPLAVSPTLPLGEGWDITMKKIAGADRAFPFTIGKF